MTITNYGVFFSIHRPSYTNDLLDQQQVEKAKVAIEALFKKRKTINTRIGSSYSLKHECERYLRKNGFEGSNYIGNGACIQAMIDLGYTMKANSDTQPNAYFNVARDT